MIIAIAAVDKNFGIGYNNKLLEHIPEDLQRFKELTTGKNIVMGSNTWESLPKRPLPNRYNMIITRNPQDKENGADYKFFSWEQVKNYLSYTKEDVFIIGGQRVYEELLPYCDQIYLTYIKKGHVNIDAYFPKMKKKEWKIVENGEEKIYNDIPYCFQKYQRIGFPIDN